MAFLVGRKRLRSVGLVGALLGLVSRGRLVSGLFWGHLDDVSLLVPLLKLILPIIHHCTFTWGSLAVDSWEWLTDDSRFFHDCQ